MRIGASYLLATFFVAQTFCHPLYGDDDDQLSSPSTETTPTTPEPGTEPSPQGILMPQPQKPFTAFTGRIVKNKVRIRLQPTLDASILREINKGDLFVVVGETDDFYAVKSPADIKGYVFRTYVLDNVVEGNRVNVRLEPSLEAPIIAQLNAGDKVGGQISAQNNKWLEIAAPDSTRFFIAKEYIEKIGDAGLKVVLDQKREEGTKLLNNTFAVSQNELRKPWNEINLDGINKNLNKIIKDYTDFPQLQTKAKELLSMIQDSYFQKKILYLESLAKNAEVLNAQNKALANKTAAQEQRINELEGNQTPRDASSSNTSTPTNETNSADRMNAWLPVENKIYESWAEIHENQPISAFYDEQMQKAVTLKGIVQLYDRAVRNKPGDFVLLNPATRIPVAYLYSTQVNLQNFAGKEVTIKASPRDNNNFAYPSYFVLSVE